MAASLPLQRRLPLDCPPSTPTTGDSAIILLTRISLPRDAVLIREFNGSSRRRGAAGD